MAEGRNNQRITVTFSSQPTGAIVDEVEFRMFVTDTEGMTEEDFKAQLIQKYGRAELVQNGDLIWCVGPNLKCAEDDEWRQEPHLIAEPGPRSIQLKFVDAAREEALEARVSAVWDARKTKVERADF